MFEFKGLGVRNLRSLRDTGLVVLKPITILVGKNSAGKSSFARILPLLKQSAERRKQVPVLWYGRLVDFGSFSDAASSLSETKEIDLLLRFRCPAALLFSRKFEFWEEGERGSNESDVDVTLTIGSASDDDRTILRSLSLSLFGMTAKLVWDANRGLQITVDDIPASVPANAVLAAPYGALFPQLRIIYREATTAAVISDAELFQPQTREKLGTSEVRAAISSFVHGNTLPERKDEIAERLPVAGVRDLFEYCRSLTGAPDTWRYNIELIDDPINSSRLRSLQRALLLYKLDALLTRLDDAISASMTALSYLEPLRATAQRYYRREEVSIDELDPKGLNTPFFVQGLSPRERESLNAWLRATFGFTLTVRNAGGHVSLTIDTELDSQTRNMADVGLGYSQIAPVAIQLWAAQRRFQGRSAFRSRQIAFRFRDTRPIVVIEQPELHLHPAYQAKLADVFAAATGGDPQIGDSARGAGQLMIVAETHSSNLINRLGELIGEGRLSAGNVSILVFEPEKPSSKWTSIRSARFDEKGVLQNWPIGFFDY